MMPVVSVNTSGARPLKPSRVKKRFEEDGVGDGTRALRDDAPVHYDSKVDKFNKRLQLVRRQIEQGDSSVTEKEVRDLSLYEFWWKYTVDRGRVKKSTLPVCLMVTPCYSADCANVEHPIHASYAKCAVIAHWRHMATERRKTLVCKYMKEYGKARSDVFIGGTAFEDPKLNARNPNEERFLGVRDLYEKFEGTCFDRKGNDECWTLALMEMLTDTVLYQWVSS